MLLLTAWCALVLAMLWLWDRRPVDRDHPGLKIMPKPPADGT